jgi:uncharacterized membrane protein YdbT with pleckstrin-like domain
MASEFALHLEKGEAVLYEGQPDIRVLWVWAVTRCLPAGAVGAFMASWCYFFFSGFVVLCTPCTGSHVSFVSGAILAGVAMLLFATGALVYNVYTRRTYRYVITNLRTVCYGGIAVHVTQTIRHEMMTSFEVTQSIVEKMAGLSTLRILFAGLSTPRSTEIAFKGLRDVAGPAEMLATACLQSGGEKV